jgi:hypothetical protein
MQSFRVIIISSRDYLLFIFRKLLQIWITFGYRFILTNGKRETQNKRQFIDSYA